MSNQDRQYDYDLDTEFKSRLWATLYSGVVYCTVIPGLGLWSCQCERWERSE